MKENILIEDFDFTLIADFFKRIDRQGPGGDNETMLAKYLLPNFEKDIRIADIGCGTGRQTAVLAEMFDGRISCKLLLAKLRKVESKTKKLVSFFAETE